MSHLAFASQGHLSVLPQRAAVAVRRKGLVCIAAVAERALHACTSGDSENYSLKIARQNQDAAALAVPLCSHVFLHTKWRGGGGGERNKDIFHHMKQELTIYIAG